VAQRAHGVPLVPAIETARGVLAAQEIAAAPAVAHLSIGGLDLLRDLYAGDGTMPMLYVRSHLVVVSRALGLPPPVDSVYPLIDDDAGLRAEAQFVRSLGFAAKSAIHPRQIPILHEVFAPSARDLAWAREVLAAFEAAGRGATRLPDGEFVDLPVAQRAQRMLDIAGRQR
jgi:citrate lyase subunit beta/citryl-CoA lyase